MIRLLRCGAFVLCAWAWTVTGNTESKAVWHFRVDPQGREFTIIAVAHVDVLKAQCHVQFLDAQGGVMSDRIVPITSVPIRAGEQRVQTSKFESGASSARGLMMDWTIPRPTSLVGIVIDGDGSETFSSGPDPE